MHAAVHDKGFAIAKRFMTCRGANIGIREPLDAAQFVDTDKPRVPLWRSREHDGESASSLHALRPTLEDAPV